MAKTTKASVRVNAVTLEWTEEPCRRELGCLGCLEPTRGGAKVRNVTTGRDESQPWCMGCALLDAFHRGRAA